MMRSVLITNSYSIANIGDQAIVASIAEQLKARGYDRVLVASRFSEDQPFLDSMGLTAVTPLPDFKGPPLGETGLGKLGRAIIGTLGALAAVGVVGPLVHLSRRSGRARRLIPARYRYLLDVDLVVACGGGYLYSPMKLLPGSLLYHCATIVSHKMIGLSPVMMPQSIGPIRSRVHKFLVSGALRSCAAVAVREHLSSAHMAGIPHVIVPDIALALRSSVEPDRTSGVVGILVMDWTWAGQHTSNDLSEYVQKMADVADRLAELELQPRFYSFSNLPEHDQDDLDIAHRVIEVSASGRRREWEALRVHSYRDAMAEFASLRCVISTRMHGALLALASGTPAFHLAYQPKGIGSFQLLGLDGMVEPVAGDWRGAAVLFSQTCQARETIDSVTAAVAAARGQLSSFLDTSIPTPTQ